MPILHIVNKQQRIFLMFTCRRTADISYQLISFVFINRKYYFVPCYKMPKLQSSFSTADWDRKVSPIGQWGLTAVHLVLALHKSIINDSWGAEHYSASVSCLCPPDWRSQLENFYHEAACIQISFHTSKYWKMAIFKNVLSSAQKVELRKSSGVRPA